MAKSRVPKDMVNTLRGEFDTLLIRLQTSKARIAMKAVFHSSPRQMGKAAVAAAQSTAKKQPTSHLGSMI
jgi:hypothetical protein